MADWIDDEFSGADFTDKRLKDRFLKIAKSFSKAPTASISKRSEDWKESKGAYRFFQNESVESDDFFKSHQDRTVERSSKYPYILALQDTSVISYNGHSHDNGMGRTRGEAWGFFLHSTVAVSPYGDFLGVLSNQIWKREERRKKINGKVTRKDGEEKENSRWTESVSIAGEVLSEKTKVVSVADRECDSNEFFLNCFSTDTEFLIRQNIDRIILNSDFKSRKYISESKILGSEDVFITNKLRKEGKRGSSFRIKGSDGKVERDTTLHYQSAEIEIDFKNATCSEVRKVNLVRVFEDNDLPDRIEWFLLTSLPAKTFEEVKLIAHYYSLRWRIELFFKTLKSGCSIEKCRLGTMDKMIKFVSLATVIAWRINWIKYNAELYPKDSASLILTPMEIKILCLKNNIESQDLNIEQAVLWVGKLGGHLNRKSDGIPGLETIWKGLEKLNNIEEGFNLFKSLIKE